MCTCISRPYLIVKIHHWCATGNWFWAGHFQIYAPGFVLPLANPGLFVGQKVCDASNFLLDDFDSKLYEQIVSSQTGTNCTPLAADLFVFCSVVSVYQ